MLDIIKIFGLGIGYLLGAIFYIAIAVAITLGIIFLLSPILPYVGLVLILIFIISCFYYAYEKIKQK